MICIIALVVFGILGIFSVKYRAIAKEAFDCVFKRLTFRKCTTGLDKRLKAQITGRLMNKTPRVGGFIYKYFELLSWIFTIMLILSIIWSGYGAYNFIRYGNCNGKDSTEYCIFNGLDRYENRVENAVSCGCTSIVECVIVGHCKDELNCKCENGVCISMED